jgi:excisionase family DNA binding protein
VKTVEQISKEMQVHQESVRRWIRTNELPAEKIGKSYYVKEEDLNVLKTQHQEMNKNERPCTKEYNEAPVAQPDSNYLERIRERISIIRTALGYNQQDLARVTGVSRVFISQLETSKCKLTRTYAILIFTHIYYLDQRSSLTDFQEKIMEACFECGEEGISFAPFIEKIGKFEENMEE